MTTAKRWAQACRPASSRSPSAVSWQRKERIASRTGTLATTTNDSGGPTVGVESHDTGTWLQQRASRLQQEGATMVMDHQANRAVQPGPWVTRAAHPDTPHRLPFLPLRERPERMSRSEAGGLHLRILPTDRACGSWRNRMDFVCDQGPRTRHPPPPSSPTPPRKDLRRCSRPPSGGPPGDPGPERGGERSEAEG